MLVSNPKGLLTFNYTENGIFTEVVARLSLFGEYMHFINEDFGETVFLFSDESLIRSTMNLSSNYLLQLRRMIKVWKKHFL